MIYGLGILIVYMLHVLLKLNWYVTGLLGIFALLMIPVHQKKIKESKEREQEFLEISLYLDTLLYSFVKEEKVDQALMDVEQTLPKGTLKDLVGKSLEYLHMTFDKTEVLQDALKMIEECYPSKRVQDIHEFMAHVEYYGGDVERPVSLLLADKSRWEQRVKGEILRRKKQLTDIILSVAMSLMICGAILYLPIGNMDISQELVVQLCSLVVVVANDLIILSGQKYLCVDWLNTQLTESEEYYVKKMKQYESYDEKKERIHSYIWGSVGLILTLLCFLYGNEWWVVFGLCITLFLFNQHRVGKGLLKKTLKKEISYAFPNWLLDLVLLLQSENVYVALEKSKAHVPGVLRKELFTLTERLEMEPESSEAYHEFLKDFEIPEIHSAMGILYSLSIGNSGNVDKQIGELVEKNLELLDSSETELLKSKASGMYGLFLLPVVVASFKLVIDMLFLMLSFVQVPVI